MKQVYLLLYFLFPAKIPNSVNESCWGKKIKMHFSLCFPSAFLKACSGIAYHLLCRHSVRESLVLESLITVSGIIGHLTLKVFIVISSEKKPV